MEKISIIIPIYNAEMFLKRCLDSIIYQEYENLEIILIDDGSKDSSGIICDEYGKKDPRIKVIHKENGGVSSARNVGIEEATGKYIHFIDADDWIEPSMYSEMMEKMKYHNVDVVRVLQKTVQKDNEMINEEINEDILIKDDEEKNRLIVDLMRRKQFPSLFLMLIKKSIIDENNLRFNNELIIGEDLIFVMQIYLKMCKMFWYKKYFYNYYVHESSAMNSKKRNKSMAMNLLVLYPVLIKLSIDYNIYDDEMMKNIALYIFIPFYKRVRKYIIDEKDKQFIMDLYNNDNYNLLISKIDKRDLTRFAKLFLYFSKKKYVNLLYDLCIIHSFLFKIYKGILKH